MTMSVDSPLSFGQALWRWVVYVLTFIVAGGVAGGLSVLTYQSVVADEPTLAVYVLIFAAAGFIAYRLMRRVIEPAST